MKLVCVIPAWNEEKKLSQVIADVRSFVDEIVVVDDCSSDKTFDIAQQSGAIVLHHIINRHQGAALRTGTEYALSHGADIVIHFDADGQFLADDIPAAVKPIIEDGYDIVFGSRFMGRDSNMPWLKKNIFFPIAKMVNLLILGVKMTDPQSGFRVMSRRAAQQIQIEQRGSAHCSEILAKAFRYKLRIKEVPITVIYHRFGQNLGGGFKIVKDLLLAKLID